jgi:hypothetical protein
MEKVFISIIQTQAVPAPAAKVLRFDEVESFINPVKRDFFFYQQLISYFALLKFLNQIFLFDVANL